MTFLVIYNANSSGMTAYVSNYLFLLSIWGVDCWFPDL